MLSTEDSTYSLHQSQQHLLSTIVLPILQGLLLSTEDNREFTCQPCQQHLLSTTNYKRSTAIYWRKHVIYSSAISATLVAYLFYKVHCYLLKIARSLHLSNTCCLPTSISHKNHCHDCYLRKIADYLHLSEWHLLATTYFTRSIAARSLHLSNTVICLFLQDPLLSTEDNTHTQESLPNTEY